MKIALKDFQEDAVSELLKEVSKAKREAREGGIQAVVLSSPTGSGKTVITAALLETILEGTDQIPAERNAVFLWVSDQPELNEQSRKKVLDSSDRIRPNDIVIIDSDFDQETFDEGKLYFINTQKLGRDKNLVTKGDLRSYSIWETIRNTEQELGDKFYLIIDEAHRGMNRSAREESYSQSIIQKLLLGDPDVGINPIKMVLGISATPERFLRLIQVAHPQVGRRIPRIVQIDPEAVRESGLLKDKIIIYHPEVEQSTDWTLLSTAAQQWVQMRDIWREYLLSQQLPLFNPVMVIQVEDRDDNNISKTKLEEIIRTLENEIGPIRDEEIAHCFEEDIHVPVGSRRIRKIEASSIQDDPDVKFVLFKMSLTTGWDCPRAEVMMSFRKAQDHTLIAQLIGRMVRSPLARRIEGQELLNSVSLYLPHYNEEGLRRVIEHLKSDPDIVPPSSVESGKHQVILYRRPGAQKIFNELEKLPTFRIERKRKTSNTRRLMKLSRLLTTFDQIDSEALEISKKLIVETIYKEKEHLRSTDSSFNEIVDNADEIIVTPVTVEQGVWTEIAGDPLKIKLTETNINELFNRCGRRLGDGLHLEYWSSYYDSNDPNRPKLELFLTLQQPQVFETLEKVCGQRLSELFNKYRVDINSLSTSEQERYYKIREQAVIPEAVPFMAPAQIIVNLDRNDPDYALYEKSLYTTQTNEFPAILNGWEKSTIEAEIQKENVVGWIRNYDRKTWSFSVPYNDGGTKPMYPDFIVVREERNNYIVDILEPHREDLDDNWKKAVGLANFAQTYWRSFGRIELIRKKGTLLKRLDLINDNVRARVLYVDSNEHLDTIFDTYSTT